MDQKLLNTLVPKSRRIDLDMRKRTKPMKILCLGLSRTGTISMWLALQKLGYTPYHMAEALKHPEQDFPLWDEALEGKYKSKGAPFGRAEFDKLLGDYDALLDMPGALFVEELTKAYPDAKFILTCRPVDGWVKSMDNSAGVVLSWRSWSLVSYFDPTLTGPWWHCIQILAECILIQDRRKLYLDHYEHVRKVVPKENLLEFHLGDSWEPLCEFLEVPVPEGPYPRSNASEDFVKLHTGMWYRAALLTVGKLSAGVALGAAVLGAVWVSRAKGLVAFRRW